MNPIQRQEKIKRLQELENHDCHLTDEDSCATCEEIWTLKADLTADEELNALERQIEIVASAVNLTFKGMGL